VKRNNILVNGADLEIYKDKCDTCCASKMACEASLQQALDVGMNISWYQQKPIAITAEIAAILLLIKVLAVK